MPTNRTKRTRAVHKGEDQVMHLCHGWCLDNMYHPYYETNGDLQFPFRDQDHRRELYFKHRNYLFSLAGKGHVDGLFAELKAGGIPAAARDYEPEIFTLKK